MSNEMENDTAIDRKKWWLVFDKPMQNSQDIAIKFMNSGEVITAHNIKLLFLIYMLQMKH